MIDVDALGKRINDVCYQHIGPHMDKYEAEKCMEDCLPLMEPQIFGGFAYRACCDVAALVNKLAREQYDLYARNIPSDSRALQEAVVEDDDEKDLRDLFLERIEPFNDALNQYYPSLQRFRQILAQANDHSGAFNIGMAAGEMFGGLMGLAVSAAGGFIRGATIGREVEAESEHLQQAFGAMLKVYDQAMDYLNKASVAALVAHHDDLVKVVGAA